jgi:hypothetical protein
MQDVEKIIHKQIRKLASDNKKKITITGDLLLKEELGFGSLDQVALFTTLTDLFKLDLMQFEDEELVGIVKVSQLIVLFEKKVYATSGG